MNAVINEITYNSPVNKVWSALTDKDQMKKWYFDIPDFELTTGSVFNFYEGPEKIYHHQAKILTIEPLKKFSHTWTHPGHSQGESVLTWELFPEGDGTRVKLTHEGLENFADGGPQLAASNYESGWKEIMGVSLKKFLEG